MSIRSHTRLYWAIVALACVVIVGTPAHAQNPGFEITMQQHAFRTVAFIGNNTGKVLRGNAVIDTGATMVFVCEEALALANIRVTDSKPATMRDATGGISHGKMITLAFVHVGNIKVENVQVMATPGRCTVPILIGMSWLSRITSATLTGQTLTLK